MTVRVWAVQLLPLVAITDGNFSATTWANHFKRGVGFVDPNVDPKTRTVGVRVVIPNQQGQLRIGDYAKAMIRVPVSAATDQQAGARALVLPRNAVLMAGDNSVVYVETDAGRFELRRVTVGPSCGDQIAILSGVGEGEQVAIRGNFLIDSQMQLAGNPSLIDPLKARPSTDGKASAEVIAALAKLTEEDRKLANRQRICPVTEMALGSMGVPKKVDVNGTPVFICSEGCRESLLEEPSKYLAKLAMNPDSQDPHGSLPQMSIPPISAPRINEPAMELPPIGVPQILGPGPELPQIEAPQANSESVTDDALPTSIKLDGGFESPGDVRTSSRPESPPQQNDTRSPLDSREAVR